MSDGQTYETSKNQYLGRTYRTSEPVFPEPEHPNSPNVVVVLFDDLGFADLGCYGSEVDTPRIDAIAAGGYRYNNFHTTALCSPSRACMLTGRNHHAIGMRMLSNVDSGWPSGRGKIDRRAALVSEVLQLRGFDTFVTGKWHIAPMREATPAGPFEEWPLGRGFNRFYGFMNGATDHFHPELVRDNHIVEPPRSVADGYHLTEDIVDEAERYISDHVAHRPDDPFFLYVPLGATHAPHHAPREYLERVRGRYDCGWDVIRRERYERQLEMGVIPPDTKLPPENPDVPKWDTLSSEERTVASRLQEAYAAFVEHTDAQIGRLIDHLDRTGQRENTLVIITSDNGAAMEGGRLGAYSRIRFFNDLEEDLHQALGALDSIGGPNADSHYARGWAQASNTPLRWYKYHTHGGGIRDPLIVSWPGHLKNPGAILKQFHHITDIAPTIYEVTGTRLPETVHGVPQMPIHGKSFAYTFEEPERSSSRRVQYFEMFGNRGLWADGWKAVTHHAKDADYESGEWELYHLDQDFSEATNLVDSHQGKLRELIDLWWLEAGRYDVLPLDDRSVELFNAPPVPGSPKRRTRFDYFPPLSHIEPSCAPPFEHAPWHQIEAKLSGEKRGVIIGYGGPASGFVLYVKDGLLTYEYNAAGDVTSTSISLSNRSESTVGVDFRLDLATRTGHVRLFVDDTTGDWIRLERVLSFLSLTGMDVGSNPLGAFSPNYTPPFPFTGSIEYVTVTVAPTTQSDEKFLDD